MPRITGPRLGSRAPGSPARHPGWLHLVAVVLAAPVVALFAVLWLSVPRPVAEPVELEFQPSAGNVGRLEWTDRGSIVTSSILDYDDVVSPPPTERVVEVELRPIGARTAEALGAQVWFYAAASDVDPEPSLPTAQRDWVSTFDPVTDTTYLLSDQPGAPLRVRVPLREPAIRLHFLANPHSGAVEVRIDGQLVAEIDLFREAVAPVTRSVEARPGLEDLSHLSTSVVRDRATTLRWTPSDTAGQIRLRGVRVGDFRWEAGDEVRLGPGIAADETDPTRFRISDPVTGWLEFGPLPTLSREALVPRRPLAAGTAAALVLAATALASDRLARSARLGRARRAAAWATPLGVALLCIALLPVVGEDAEPELALDDLSDSFRLTALADGFDVPVGAAFTADGTLFVIEKGGFDDEGVGRVLRVEGGDRDVVLELPVCASSERGLLGIALDPDFDDNGFVYLDYTTPDRGCASGPGSLTTNRVSRFTLVDDEIDPATEAVLVDGLLAGDGAHVGGGLRIAPDGHLLVGVGEGARHQNPSRDLGSLGGKVLRVRLDPDQPFPADNPFADADGDAARLVLASGFRNPYRLSVHPIDGTIVAGDVGSEPPRAAEELDVVEAGADYGWPDQEGLEPLPPGVTGPAWSYEHDADCNTIVPGPFVTSDRYGASLRDAVLVADFSCGRVWAVHLEGGVATRVVDVIDDGEGRSIVDGVAAPDGAVVFVDISGTLWSLELVD